MSDPCVEAGAAAAAAAADGAAGEHGRQSAAGEVHQHHAGHRHRHPGVRVHRREIRGAVATQSPPPGAHLRGRVRVSAAVEELGAPAVRSGATAPAPLTPGTGGDQRNPTSPRTTETSERSSNVADSYKQR